MSIGLNYTHVPIGEGRILPNYLYLLPSRYRPDADLDREQLEEVIEEGELIEQLRDDEIVTRFDHPLIKDILEVAYPYEVALKFCRSGISNQPERNEQLKQLFNRFFSFDYEETLDTYCQRGDNEELYQKSQTIRHEKHYDERATAVEQFLAYVQKLLQVEGYREEATYMRQFAEKNLVITYTEGITGVTSASGENVVIEVGNSTYTTLYHELAHFINRFFRYHYYENYEVCFDNYTKTNEGFANFVAYHLPAYIQSGEVRELEEIPLDERFFSPYIDVYATLREHGSTDRSHNYDIVYQQMKAFEDELLTDAKANFYYQRFYKYFHYDQHYYFYPKEMMYYLGYQQIRSMFGKATDKSQLLAQLFLGKICL